MFYKWMNGRPQSSSQTKGMQSSADNLPLCAERCVFLKAEPTDVHCKGFAYNTQTKTCILYSSLDPRGQLVEEEGTNYYPHIFPFCGNECSILSCSCYSTTNVIEYTSLVIGLNINEI